MVCAVIAVVLDGKAYGSLASVGRSVSKKSIVTCIVSGVLMGLWAPFVAHAMTQGQHARPLQHRGFPHSWSAALVLHLECLFHEEAAGGRARELRRLLSWTCIRPRSGTSGRSDLGTGMVFNLVAASFTGVAISYAIGQSAPMVAALWGVLAWKEFKGAGSKAYIYLFLMFVFYALAIALVAHANG